MKNTVYVFVSGGVVQDVLTKHKDEHIEVVIVDYDVDGSDDELGHTIIEGMRESANVYTLGTVGTLFEDVITVVHNP